MSNIFTKRVNLKPYEYPQLVEYADAVRHSYWVHTEFNFTSSIQDFKVSCNKEEQSVIERAMLAIAQIEVNVKTFWGDIYKKMPKPEVGAVGYTFAESEVRHMDAYSHLLEVLGLNKEFKNITKVPAMKKRIEYLTSVVDLGKSLDNKEYVKSILLFSLFIENVSLFSQFLIMMSFNKHKNLFKGISNAVEATSKEEQIHALFGIDLINIIKKENKAWFDKAFEEEIQEYCMQMMDVELEVVDWIYEKGDLDFIPKAVVVEFLKERYNTSLKSVGFKKPFDIKEELIEQTAWFDNEVIATKHVDFFDKRSINYNKRSASVTSQDLF